VPVRSSVFPVPQKKKKKKKKQNLEEEDY